MKVIDVVINVIAAMKTKCPSPSPEMRTRSSRLLHYYTLNNPLHTALICTLHTNTPHYILHIAPFISHFTKPKALATAVKDSVLRFLASEFAWFTG